jgi:hypothetical protein
MTSQDAHALVTAHLTRLIDDAALWRTWALTLSRFHRYSLANTLLIAIPRPDATYVAGYRRRQQAAKSNKANGASPSWRRWSKKPRWMRGWIR